MSEDRADAAEADEDGGGGDGVFFSAGKPLSTGKRTAMVSRKTGQRNR